MNNVILTLDNISKSFDGTPVLEHFHLEIKEHEFVTLLGPSGCGKTTTLRIIGGFETPDEGEVLFEGKPISKIPPNKRPFNTVFQKYSLFSHMNIYENIAFGLRIKKMKKEEIDRKVKEALRMVNLSGFEKRMPESLSGGQQQRIAIARAIVNEPKVLLFDEPLGALDLKLRQEMQFELKSLQRELGITFLYVTHDQEEALTMSDTIVVMSEGVIQQLGSPVDIYNEPENAFVARFIGESNIVDGIMKEDFKVVFSGREFTCVDQGFEKDEPVDVVVRPEDVKVVPRGEGMLDVTVNSVVFKGVHYEMLLQGEDHTWLVQSTKAQQEGAKVSINIFPDEIHIMHKSQK
ncbi:MAG: spermidine/putrescine ABC transporter ATP-binding protein [Clostridia bacterium]|nr:spermidine/putrescine ABC transporter ATP-binding protein [Clostridia bacterium]